MSSKRIAIGKDAKEEKHETLIWREIKIIKFGGEVWVRNMVRVVFALFCFLPPPFLSNLLPPTIVFWGGGYLQTTILVYNTQRDLN